MTTNIQEGSKQASQGKSRLYESYPNLEIRLACVEDGLDNTGFRKISAYIKSIHQNTKIAYIPTSNYRNIIGQLIEKEGGSFGDKDIYRVAEFMAKADIAAFSSMTQSSFTVYKIIDQVRKINPKSYIISVSYTHLTLPTIYSV